MNGKLNTIGMTLLIIASALAGCTSGDPDGVDSSEIDADTLGMIEQLLNNSVDAEWINDRGDSSQYWEISLEDEQWLEVKSVMYVLQFYEDNESSSIMNQGTVLSSEGFRVGSGFSPIFGGIYSSCASYYGSEYPCLNEDLDGDWTVSEWTIIYRVH